MSSEQAMSSYVDELKKVQYLTVFILFVSVVKWLVMQQQCSTVDMKNMLKLCACVVCRLVI